MVSFARGLCRISRRTSVNRYRWLFTLRNEPSQMLQSTHHSYSLVESSQKVLGCRVISSWVSNALTRVEQQIQGQSSPGVEEDLDPFSLVADELSILANGLRSMVVAEVPNLASAAEYFFKIGAEGKRFRPTP